MNTEQQSNPYEKEPIMTTAPTTSPLQSPTILRIVESEGLEIKAVGGELDGQYFEIDMPLAINAVEAGCCSQVSVAWDTSLPDWQVYLDTAVDHTIDAAYARDFGAQVIRAAALAERLNEEVAG
ncbi:hypothetical protein [Salinibacterium sp.]|uniref:hypothetical protein n=1 Tax=Salinibacterium sp. TaxID=1915057 RepID=UPI00286CDB55|nr:hypothetical protein [Salinibacterium sp.]